MAKQKQPPAVDVDSRSVMPPRQCPQHRCAMEPVGIATGEHFYYCPTGGALRAWRPVFRLGE